MITPSPTSKIAPSLARGILAAVEPAAGSVPAKARLAVPNTSYDLSLVLIAAPNTPVGKRIVGRISVRARRLDVVNTGGRYVEPVAGRPRRVQGSVIEIDERANTVIVNAGVPVHLVLTAPGQRAAAFARGQLVSCDVMDGATFEETRQTDT